jgi:enoyl-CoA hydratase/carnithine racemase
MSGPVSSQSMDTVAVITVDSPPLNLLSTAVRTGLRDCLREALSAPNIAAVVIRCTGRSFCAGFDITEFDQPLCSPTLRELVDEIERSAKPIVAQLHGTVFGGGLELALACHGRVAPPGTRLGLVEVKLGLLPGCGGTQRLPRVIDLPLAAGMTATGQALLAHRAQQEGLLDAIDSDPAQAAVALARRLAAGALPRATSKRAVRAADTAQRALALLATELDTSHPGTRAPLNALAAVEAATRSADFDTGLAREWALFTELLESPQREPQFHLFFAERQLAAAARDRACADLALHARTGLSWLDTWIALCAAANDTASSLALTLDVALAAQQLDTLSDSLWSAEDVTHATCRMVDASKPGVLVRLEDRGLCTHRTRAPVRGEHSIADVRLALSDEPNRPEDAVVARLHLLAQPVGRRVVELRIASGTERTRRAAAHLLGAAGFLVVPVHAVSAAWPSTVLNQARQVGAPRLAQCAAALRKDGVLATDAELDVLAVTAAGAARHTGGPCFSVAASARHPHH